MCRLNNVVVHCGINSIRLPTIESDEQVRDVYAVFKGRIDHIMRVNKRAKIYVSTLLPTKIDDCNVKLMYFNKLLIDDLGNSFNNNVRIVNHFHRFANSRGHLNQHLSKELNRNNEPDMLHLNEAGLRVFSVTIKNSIFVVKHEGRDKGAGGRRGGRGSSVGTGGVQRGPMDYAGAMGRPRGGGRNNRGWCGSRR